MKRGVTLSVVSLAASTMVHPAYAFNGTAVQPPGPGISIPFGQIPSFPGGNFFNGNPGLHGVHGTVVNPGPPTNPNGVMIGASVVPSPPAIR